MEFRKMFDVYTSLFNTIPDPFFVISENGDYLEVLGGAERSLYDDGSSLKGRNIFDFSEPVFARFFMGQVRKTLESGLLNCFEYQLETSKVDLPKNGPGGTQWFEARLYPLSSLFQGQRAVTAMIINISERKTLQQKLRELSYLDPLTAVANRRFFLERLSEELESYHTEKIPVSVLIMDIDHFKHINDSYGHLAGDYMLKELVLVSRKLLNKPDTIARFGGDEFIVSLVGTDIGQALELAEKLRVVLQNHEFVYEDIHIPLTISIGVSDATEFDTDISSIISRADKALYQAKEAGRNRTHQG